MKKLLLILLFFPLVLIAQNSPLKLEFEYGQGIFLNKKTSTFPGYTSEGALYFEHLDITGQRSFAIRHYFKNLAIGVNYTYTGLKKWVWDNDLAHIYFYNETVIEGYRKGIQTSMKSLLISVQPQINLTNKISLSLEAAGGISSINSDFWVDYYILHEPPVEEFSNIKELRPSLQVTPKLNYSITSYLLAGVFFKYSYTDLGKYYYFNDESVSTQSIGISIIYYVSKNNFYFLK